MYPPVETTSAVWVDTYEGVLQMLEELKQAKEIAVDLEHHDYRTYAGLLSLMQISTRQKDWIVDTLQPWRHKLEILNEVFADPSILKVKTTRSRACPTRSKNTTVSFAYMNWSGFPWCLHGYRMASKRSWSVRRGTVRHFSRMRGTRVPCQEPCVST